MISGDQTQIGLEPFSEDELRAAVMALRPRSAVFDCDGTLWAPDSGLGFLDWSLRQALVSVSRRSWIEARYRLYESGQVDEATICGEMVQLYAGLPEQELREAAAQYVREHVRPKIFSSMLRLARTLAEAGTELWAVSSTCNWVVEAGVWDHGQSPFAIPSQRILAARVAIESGTATERLLAVPTDEAKALALTAAGLATPDVVFGNSVHDAAMLAVARHAFPVNPSPDLMRLAEQRGWRVFLPGAADAGPGANMS